MNTRGADSSIATGLSRLTDLKMILGIDNKRSTLKERSSGHKVDRVLFHIFGLFIAVTGLVCL